MKPEIICYMMSSLDGRIDCKMTAQLEGNEDYYKVLKELNLPTTVSGKVTAETEMALPGKYTSENSVPYGKTGFKKNREAAGYEVILDTKGELLWPDDKDAEKPHLIVTSEQVSQNYLNYLDERHISWIVTGKKSINLTEAADLLSREFGVKRMGIVGGPTINTAFLEEGLLDEIVVLIGPGIDGRKDQISLFSGRDSDTPVQLQLEEAKSFPSGAVLLKYHI